MKTEGYVETSPSAVGTPVPDESQDDADMKEKKAELEASRHPRPRGGTMMEPLNKATKREQRDSPEANRGMANTEFPNGVDPSSDGAGMFAGGRFSGGGRVQIPRTQEAFQKLADQEPMAFASLIEMVKLQLHDAKEADHPTVRAVLEDE